MIPRTAGRGHSFIGAGLYYLHDKQATTNDRVAWTYTHNLPTQDPEKAMKVMAFTAMNAAYYKDMVGGSKAGRKATRGAVFTFSLAWHPEQSPDKLHMLDTAFSALEELGLKENHQAVIVAHKDTDHPHVHIIANAVSTADGKRAKLSYDYLSLSTWAQEYEEKNGHKIYCKERVRNNEERAKLAQEGIKKQRQSKQQDFKSGKIQDKPKTGIVKHKEEKLKQSLLIQDLYRRSDSGQAFQAALEENGYTLSNGNRRSFIVIDERGKPYSLSRQMKGFWQKDEKRKWKSDLKEKLAGLTLQDAEAVRKQKAQAWEEKHHHDSIQETIDRDNRLLEVADKFGQKPKKRRTQIQKPANDQKPEIVQNNDPPQLPKDKKPDVIEPYAEKLDRIQEYERAQDWQMSLLKEKLNTFYKPDDLRAEIKALKKGVDKTNTPWGRMTSRYKDRFQELQDKQQEMADIQDRIKNQISALQKKHELEREGWILDPPANDELPIDRKHAALERHRAKIKIYDEKQRQEREQKQDREGPTYNL